MEFLKSRKSRIGSRIFITFVIAITLWLFLCVGWVTLTTDVRMAQDSRWAARAVLGVHGRNIVRQTDDALVVIAAAAVHRED